jgi:hypothetical protein
VSALGHFLEEEGLATTIVSLIRLHSETIQPPRTLFVDFELGRPLGGPHDKATQRRVLEATLRLLESDAGPVLLVDDDSSDPGTDPDPDLSWRNPVLLESRSVDPADIEDSRAKLLAEIAEVEPVYRKRLEALKRTTFGVTGLDIEGTALYILSYLAGRAEPTPNPDMSPNLAMRFAVDDLKTFYLEAASFADGTPSSRQLGLWFWRQTVAATLIIALRAQTMQSEIKSLKLIGTVFLVPRIWVEELEL